MSSRKLNPASNIEGNHAHAHAQPYRKKYGKNLHKLHSQLSATTAPPPPITSLSFNMHTNALSSKKASGGKANSSSGGLLLLSTKKGNLDRKNSAIASGGDATRPRPDGSGGGAVVTRTTASKTGKGQSTHDALLSVLNGEKEGKKEVVPLAWGMKAPPSASSQQASTQTSQTASQAQQTQNAQQIQQEQKHRLTTTAGASSDNAETNVVPSQEKVQIPLQSRSQSATSPQLPMHDGDHAEVAEQRRPSLRNVENTPSNDQSMQPPQQAFTNRSRAPELTSEPIPSPTPTAQLMSTPAPASDTTTVEPPVPKENQVEFMKKLARERAEKLRLEEEKRVSAQKERAALRLKELELKMKEKESPTAAALKLKAQTQQPSPQVQIQRSLYDPDRSYSSLLGGGGSTNANNTASNSNLLGHNRIQNDVIGNTNQDNSGLSTIPIDYEDRGSRSNTGPRMLFDPKSGSMIAAPGAKDKKTPKKKITRTNVGVMGNHNDSNTSNVSSVSAGGRNRENDYGIDLEEEGMSVSRRKNSKHRQKDASRKSKRKDDNGNTTFTKPRKGSVATTKLENQSSKRGRTLPRTCGVLYKKDANGQLVSADGCEGDQGYGAHSVPGGRIRNPTGYSAFKRKGRMAGKQGRKSSTNTTDVDTVDVQDGVNHIHPLAPHGHQRTGIPSHVDYDYNRGLNRSHFMRKNQHPRQEDALAGNGVNLPSSILDVVTGDEKLDLLSGLDHSPKLQATAAAWAPSEAVLALAAANAKKMDVSLIQDSDSRDAIGESGVHALSAMTLVNEDSAELNEIKNNSSIEASPSIGLGLGFDPSKNMDSLMMSPSLEGQSSEAVSDLSPFALKNSASMSKLTSNPFVSANGLLGSATWSTSNNTNNLGSLSNWDLIGSKTNNQGNDVKKTEASSSFLSLGVGGSQTTWGTNVNGSAFTGFNSIDSPSMGKSD